MSNRLILILPSAAIPDRYLSSEGILPLCDPQLRLDDEDLVFVIDSDERLIHLNEGYDREERTAEAKIMEHIPGY